MYFSPPKQPGCWAGIKPPGIKITEVYCINKIYKGSYLKMLSITAVLELRHTTIPWHDNKVKCQKRHHTVCKWDIVWHKAVKNTSMGTDVSEALYFTGANVELAALSTTVHGWRSSPACTARHGVRVMYTVTALSPRRRKQSHVTPAFAVHQWCTSDVHVSPPPPHKCWCPQPLKSIAHRTFTKHYCPWPTLTQLLGPSRSWSMYWPLALLYKECL